MKKVVLSLAAIISTGSVFAECGEHYPENQGHGCIYAYRFGKSKEPGPRERVFEFKETRSLGTVLFASGNHLTVAAQGADGAWTPLKRIDADGERATSEPFWEKESKYSVWYAPKGFAAKAVKAVVDIPASESPAADGFYEAAVGGLLTWSNKWVNVAPLATPFASSNPRDAKIVTNGRVNSWGEWTSESNGRVISPENPQSVGLAWVAPVEISSLALDFCGFSEAEIQVFVGKGHPKDGAEKDWKTVRTVTDARTWYPCRSNMILVDLPQPVRSRGLRVKIVKPMNSKKEHPHTCKRSKEGEVAVLRELVALASYAEAKAVRAALKASAPPEVGIPIAFDMPFDGLATLVIEDKDGKRVRNLVSAQPFKKGRNVVRWDTSDDLLRDADAAAHGLYRVPFRAVAPGEYRVKGIAHAPIETFYEFSIYNSGTPPWSLPDHTGAWLANHSSPCAGAYLTPRLPGEAPRLVFGGLVTEGPDGIALADLDGRKIGGRGWVGGIWTCASYLAADVGEQADTNLDYFVAARYWGDKKEKRPPVLRLTAIKRNGQEQRYQPVTLPDDVELKETVGGLAVRNGDIAISLTSQDKVLVTNPVTQAWREIPVLSPRGLAYETSGSLLVLSGNTLVRLGESQKTLYKGFDNPCNLAVDGNTVCVSCRGESHQVWVLDLDGFFGAKVVRKIGRPGAPKTGVYDEKHMNNPAAVCLDPRGHLWVVEEDYLPKRVSCWNLKDGELVLAKYGPAKYGAGGMFDPRDPSLFYYSEGGGLMEFKVDWASGTSRLSRVLSRPKPGVKGERDSEPPQHVIYTPSGRRLYTNCWNASPCTGSAARLWKEVNDELVEVMSLGTNQHGGGGVTFADDGTVLWQKTPAPVEKGDHAWKAGGPGEVVRFRPLRYDSEGIPVYDFTKPEVLFGNSRYSGSTGGNQMVVDPKGNAFITAPAGDSPSHSVCGGRNGKILWTYPNMWPGLHAGHCAPRVSPKGRLIAVTRMLGDAVPVDGTGERIVGVNGNQGEIYFFTTDGYFLDYVFECFQRGTPWKFKSLARGTALKNTSFFDEHFWPTLNRTPDGQLYLVCGKEMSAVVRLEGFKTLTRLDAGKVKVTAKDVLAVQDAQAKADAARRAAEGLGTLVCNAGDAPTVDGDLADWDLADFVTIENRGVAAYFNSNSKPYDIRGGLRSTKTHLYAAWKCEGVRDLARNSGENAELQFKTGGACDLMLRTDPLAKGDKPQPGDVRLLASFVPGPKDGRGNITKWVPRVMLYEQKAKAADAAKRVPFESPVMKVDFDRVEDVTDKCRFVQGKTGDYELEVPLEVVGFKPKMGLKTLGDIGVLRGADGATIARLYWANKATSIVSDVPSEAMLVPKNWGSIEVK